jgi:hypothetical protein
MSILIVKHGILYVFKPSKPKLIYLRILAIPQRKHYTSPFERELVNAV